MQDPFPDENQMTDPVGYNRFGRWINALNVILETTSEEVAKMIDYDKGAFSAATYGVGGVSRQTFNNLLRAYHSLAITRSVRLPVTWQLFLALAWVGEDTGADLSVVKGGAEALEHIEWVAQTMKKLRQLRKENTRFKELRNWKRGELLVMIAQLEAEKEELQREVTKLRQQRW